MRHRWRIVAAIIAGGIVLGLAIGGLPNHRSDTRLTVVPTTTTPVGSTGATATAP